MRRLLFAAESAELVRDAVVERIACWADHARHAMRTVAVKLVAAAITTVPWFVAALTLGNKGSETPTE